MAMSIRIGKITLENVEVTDLPALLSTLHDPIPTVTARRRLMMDEGGSEGNCCDEDCEGNTGDAIRICRDGQRGLFPANPAQPSRLVADENGLRWAAEPQGLTNPIENGG